MKCGSPPSIPHGFPVGGHGYGDSVQYTCTEGFYSTRPRARLICLYNGTWQWENGRLPACQRKYK